MAQDFEIKVKWAYLRFKRKLTVVLGLYFIAILMSVSLILASEFVFNNPILKLWSTVLVVILFVKISHDTRKNLRYQYAQMAATGVPGKM